jgi:hypothetical protein
MTAIDLGLMITESAAVMLAAGSLWLMTRGWKSGKGFVGSGAEAGVSPSGTRDQLRQLVEESQALCDELLQGLEAGKVPQGAPPPRDGEKIDRLSGLLHRLENVSVPGAPPPQGRRYQEAIGLAEKGLSRSEIGKRLGLTKGEVQLLLDLKAYCLK